jgi:hypothetical protein
MARKRYKPEEIVAKLRQVDVLVSQWRTHAKSWAGTNPLTLHVGDHGAKSLKTSHSRPVGLLPAVSGELG